jgi:hypothetical protein
MQCKNSTVFLSLQLNWNRMLSDNKLFINHMPETTLQWCTHVQAYHAQGVYASPSDGSTTTLLTTLLLVKICHSQGLGSLPSSTEHVFPFLFIWVYLQTPEERSRQRALCTPSTCCNHCNRIATHSQGLTQLDALESSQRHIFSNLVSWTTITALDDPSLPNSLNSSNSLRAPTQPPKLHLAVRAQEERKHQEKLRRPR